MIINHDDTRYRKKWHSMNNNKFDGAFFYSKEICKYMIPNVKTTRNWITINADVGLDHSIVFIHNNLHPENYNYLKDYKDLILVCGVEETQDKVRHLGTPIYLPLSVKVDEVAKYKTKKTRDTAYVGRRPKRDKLRFPSGTDYIENLPRTKLLELMAQYQKIYAVGRTAIEGLILDCEILPYDTRYPDVTRWKILDTLDAAEILQQKLNEVD